MQQHKGLQLLRNVPPVAQAVLDDDARGQALQHGVVDGLDSVAGELLLVQQVARSLLEGIGAVEVAAARDQQVHDVRVAVGRRHVQGAEAGTTTTTTWVRRRSPGHKRGVLPRLARRQGY